KYFYPLTSDQACFKNKYRNVYLPNARLLAQQILSLPIYEGLSKETIDRIVELF
ncbi:MAG: DegT/DnrJ/EryC1/StrS family aminotransferase, partial [Lachnospiraceae bacterium]|nr:DegT/DnrJ/EryC1/StrS family aminotransferase [Lachnospiraceae bacterium]